MYVHTLDFRIVSTLYALAIHFHGVLLCTVKPFTLDGRLLHSVEVVDSQVSLDGVETRATMTPWWPLPVLWTGSHYPLGSSRHLHTCSVPKYGKTP